MHLCYCHYCNILIANDMCTNTDNIRIFTVISRVNLLLMIVRLLMDFFGLVIYGYLVFLLNTYFLFEFSF